MRTPYGGNLRISVPLRLAVPDPHDPFDVSAALLTSCLFEPLFATTSAGQNYPTLAASAPRPQGGGLHVELRPGLRDSRGGTLDAPAVVRSLQGARERDPRLDAWDHVQARGETSLFFSTQRTGAELARLLALPSAAIVPRSGATGALAPAATTWQRLARNPWAARGGSYLDTVLLASRDLRGCLRDFETGLSELGFLGSGLHQRDTAHRQITLAPLGHVIILPGQRLHGYAAPGVLSVELARAAPAGLRALGVKPLESTTLGTWRGPAARLLVDAGQPWLTAIAEELARVWSGAGSRIQAEPVPSPNLARARESGDFDMMVLFLRRTDGELDRTRLYQLDGITPPKRETARALSWTARRLRLGILGSLQPWFAVPRDVHGLSHQGSFDLGSTFFARGAH